MLKIATSTCGRPINDEMFANLKTAGISATEISWSFLKDAKKVDFNELKTLSDKYGIEIWSYHLPFLPFDEIDPSSTSQEIQEYTFEVFMDFIKKGVNIGIKKFVVHPSGEPLEENIRKEKLECTSKFLSRLADAADELGAVIAVEDLPRTCIGKNSDEIKYILDHNDKLKVCFDVNHLLSEKITHFIDAVGDKIATVHISDYDFIDERHWLPGEGDIDWKELYDKLLSVGYNGPWLYEVSFADDYNMLEGLLNYTDFYNNANEIFAGKKPTAIRKRKENLC